MVDTLPETVSLEIVVFDINIRIPYAQHMEKEVKFTLIKSLHKSIGGLCEK